MMHNPARDPLIARFGLQPLPGATRVTDAQIEQAHAKEKRRRWERIQAGNDAVDTYMRESGTRNYPAAFRHILRTRQDLFAGMQDPSGVVAAANFNPTTTRWDGSRPATMPLLHTAGSAGQTVI